MAIIQDIWILDITHNTTVLGQRFFNVRYRISVLPLLGSLKDDAIAKMKSVIWFYEQVDKFQELIISLKTRIWGISFFFVFENF